MIHLFKRDPSTYDTSRPDHKQVYIENAMMYLRRTFNDPDLERHLKEVIDERITVPMAEIQYHPVYGKTEQKTLPLSKFAQFVGDDILSPAGTVYLKNETKTSMLARILEGSIAERNVFKKEMLDAAAKGETVKEQNMKLLQASAKIFNNAIPGQTGSPYSFLYDIPGFNAITSVGRLCVKTGYAHVERMVSGNIFIQDFDDIVDYVQNHLRYCDPKRVRDVIDRHGLTVPHRDHLERMFRFPLKFQRVDDHTGARMGRFLADLSPEERAYVYYVYQLKHLLFLNETWSKTWITDMFRRDVPMTDESLENIFSVEDDLLNMALSRNFDLIKRESDFKEAIRKTPEGIRHLLSICRHMERSLERLRDVWETFFQCDSLLTNVWISERIVRRAVLTSDTDSVIFTTNELVSWYAPDDRFSEDARDMNALAVYLVSQTLEHVFLVLTARMGIDPKHREKIRMKNEFYYPIFLRSPLKKHYAGKIVIQEGKILPKPKIDLKGGVYVSSTLPAYTHERFREVLTWVLDEMETSPAISFQDYLRKVAEVEYVIYLSLMEGQTHFLSSMPIKEKTAYKNAMQSPWFQYHLWSEVFATTFEAFDLPNKVFVLPVKNNGRHVFDPEWREKLKAFDPDLETRFMAFLDHHKKKSLGRIILPFSLRQIPQVFRDLIDIRHILHTNGKPFYLLGRSLGVAFADKKLKLLALDFVEMKDPPNIAF